MKMFLREECDFLLAETSFPWPGRARSRPWPLSDSSARTCSPTVKTARNRGAVAQGGARAGAAPPSLLLTSRAASLAARNAFHSKRNYLGISLSLFFSPAFVFSMAYIWMCRWRQRPVRGFCLCIMKNDKQMIASWHKMFSRFRGRVRQKRCCRIKETTLISITLDKTSF